MSIHYLPSKHTIGQPLLDAIEKDRDILCPRPDDIFKAFEITPLNDIKVVILGQDPYHTPGKASGLAFGYHPEYEGPVDSSLQNIMQEVLRSSGQEVIDLSLESWAKQGVLLLNTRLTTVLGKPLAHAGLGWENEIGWFIERIGDTNAPHVYMLWGREAQGYKKFINKDYNLVLEASHPCAFSAHHSFNGCDHFAIANNFLAKHGRGEIKWGVGHANIIA